MFDGSPGTAAPPATLGPYTMTPFADDTRPVFDDVSSVPAPTGGVVGFSPDLNHREIGNGWATWSHGYTGDVYYTNGATSATMTLPAGTKAFYFYAEPNPFAVFEITATTNSGTTSGPIPVDGAGGATYFGFYTTGYLRDDRHHHRRIDGRLRNRRVRDQCSLAPAPADHGTLPGRPVARAGSNSTRGPARAGPRRLVPLRQTMRVSSIDEP